MSTKLTPTLDTMRLLDELPFADINTLDFPVLDNESLPPVRGHLLAHSQLLPPMPDALLFADALDHRARR